MKSLSRYILVLWGMLAFSVLVNGQSIDSLVNQAISANPELKAMELEYDAAMLSGRQYGQLPDPELGLGVFALQPETRVGPQWFRFGVMQMLPWKGTLDARVTLEDRKARVKLEDVASKKLRLILAVNQAYLDLYQYQEEAQILKRKQTLFRSLEALALSRVESGMGDLADVLLVQLQSSELELEIQKLENKRHIPLAELNALRAAPARQEIFISDSLGFAFIPYERAALLEEIKTNHPRLIALEAMQEVSQQSKVVNELSGKPVIGVGIDYLLVTKRTDMDVPGNGKDVLMPKVSVTLPLNRTKYEARNLQEDILIQSLDHRKEDLLRTLEVQVETARTNWQEAEIEQGFYKDQLSTIQATIRVLEELYSTKGQRMDELILLYKKELDYERKNLLAILKSHRALLSIESMLID